MRISIYSGSAFPISEIHKSDFFKDNIDIDEDTLIRWKKAFKDFEKVQEEISQTLTSQKQGVWDNWNWIGYHLDEF